MDNAFEKEVWKALQLLWLKINSDRGSDAEVLNTYPSVCQTALSAPSEDSEDQQVWSTLVPDRESKASQAGSNTQVYEGV